MHVGQYLLGARIDEIIPGMYPLNMAKRDSATSELFSELSKLGAAKGGRARANVLTPEERSEIARNAVQTRWAKAKVDQPKTAVEQVSNDPARPAKGAILRNPAGLPIELFKGELTMGNVTFPVYVLDNGKRVMAQREVVRALTGQLRGDILRYIGSASLADFIDSRTILEQTMRFAISGTQLTGVGYEATLLRCGGRRREPQDRRS